MTIKTISIATASLLMLAGCAGSASHRVVNASQPADNAMACQEVDAEIMRAQAVINGVNEDKEDISGADVVDGLLWFPFNLIAKASNYSSALTAANQRIINMKDLKKTKQCEEDSTQDQNVASESFTKKIRDLNQLHKDGLLSDDEYIKAKQQLLSAGP